MTKSTFLPPIDEFKRRFSISTNVFTGYEPVCERSLSKLAKAGITGIELLESPGQFDLADRDSVTGVLEACRNTGLSIFAFHVHFLTLEGVFTDDALQKKLDLCYRQIDNLELCGGGFWACHIQNIDIVAIRALEALGQYLEGRSVRIGLENFAKPGMWVDDRLEVIGKLDHPKIGLLLDIGHVRDLQGRNPMTIQGQAISTILKTKSRLFHVHLHGFSNGVDHFAPLCEEDEIRWEEVFQGLDAIEYDGYYNFEPKGKPKHLRSIEYTGNFYTNFARIHV